MSIKLRRQEECKQIRAATEKTKYCLIFSREIFYVAIVLCLNILYLKAFNEITARQTRTSLCKRDVIKACSIEYLTTQIELVLTTFFQLLGRLQQLGLLSSLWNRLYLSQYNSLLFLTHPVYSTSTFWYETIRSLQRALNSSPTVSFIHSNTSKILIIYWFNKNRRRSEMNNKQKRVDRQK